MLKCRIFIILSASLLLTGPIIAQSVSWVSTTRQKAWTQNKSLPMIVDASLQDSLSIYVDQPVQSMDGFGTCFNELGYVALSHLSTADRSAVMKELFAPGVGASFSMARMPVGANDFSKDWYSYDEKDGDFSMRYFSISHDRNTLIPFIREALKYQPGLQLWASPWSPPTWMKYNKHYAMALPPSVIKGVDNGMRPDQVGKEGEDMFVQQASYFKAYANYFKKFILSYRKEGIRIGVVMPQNEFNSAQWYPSCTWTPQGISNFLPYLSETMKPLGVKIFFGTLERPNSQLFETVYNNPSLKPLIAGVAVQWAGKEAIATIHAHYPKLDIWQSEQECGNGLNSWDYAVYGFDLIKHYILNGAKAYFYWNTALTQGGVNRWGWKQNSLITVDTVKRTYQYTYDYYVFKHLTHFVHPGAKLLRTSSPSDVIVRDDVLGWWKGKLTSNKANVLAFRNTDGSVAVILFNNSSESKSFPIRVGNHLFSPVLAAYSFNSFLVKP